MNPNDYWYPWYPHRYLNSDKTIGLTLEQDAIYRRLLDRYMIRREPLPSGGQAVANICMISLEKWLEHSIIILQFFEENNGKLHHKTCDIELNRQDSYSKKMSNNAKMSYEKRNINQQLPSGGLAAAAIQDRTGQDKTIEEDNNPPIPPIEKKDVSHAKRKSSFISEDFRPDLGGIELCSKLGIDADQATREFIDYWLGVGKPKCDWQATFRNRVRKIAEYRTEREQRKSSNGQGSRDVAGAALRAYSLRVKARSEA